MAVREQQRQFLVATAPDTFVQCGHRAGVASPDRRLAILPPRTALSGIDAAFRCLKPNPTVSHRRKTHLAVPVAISTPRSPATFKAAMWSRHAAACFESPRCSANGAKFSSTPRKQTSRSQTLSPWPLSPSRDPCHRSSRFGSWMSGRPCAPIAKLVSSASAECAKRLDSAASEITGWLSEGVPLAFFQYRSPPGREPFRPKPRHRP